MYKFEKKMDILLVSILNTCMVHVCKWFKPIIRVVLKQLIYTSILR